MAEDIVGGLFGINPAMYQQQQQKQVFDRAVALQNLDPFQQAAVGYQQAGYNLAGALGGAMGGVDPQLQRISTLNAISKQIDQTNPESMLQGAKMLADAGFMQEALGLAQYARKANSELALAQQRQREGAVASTDAIKNATALADASGFTKGTPAYNDAYKAALTAQTAKPDKAESKSDFEKLLDTSGLSEPEKQDMRKAKLAKETAKPADKQESKSDFEKLLDASGLSEDEKQKLRQAKLAKETTSTPGASVKVDVQAYTPASVVAQQDFIKSATAERTALRNAPDTLDNIEAAKKLIPTASTFMGKGGEPLLAAASFLNNRLGFAISTKGVTDATVLRTRLFEGILDNLKKLDSQPSQEQQRVLAEALGNLGTDPAALEQILDRIGETVRARVERYNTEVTDAEGRGVKFPYTPQLKLAPRKSKPADGAALIPTGKPAVVSEWKVIK